MKRQIYLDYNATTPLAQEVAQAMSLFLHDAYGNPSSLHWAGSPARAAVDRARAQIASLLNCTAEQVVFTSGGTEANNYAIKGLYFARLADGKPVHIITSQIEHPAVLQPCCWLERLGAQITRLRVDRHGLVDPEDVRRAMRPETALVSVMHANNEVGTIQPIAEIAAIAHEHGALCHSDAAQTAGKISVDVRSLDVDLLSIAGHKLYGPKGVGALFVRDGVKLEPLMHGAGHESGRRAGTENVLPIVGLGVACELAQRWVDNLTIVKLRDAFWQKLQGTFGERVVHNGHPEKRLPNTLSVSFVGQHGHDILSQLPQVAASTGSACHSGSVRLSPVLAAMGVPENVGLGSVRFSLGRDTTAEEIIEVVDALRPIILK